VVVVAVLVETLEDFLANMADHIGEVVLAVLELLLFVIQIHFQQQHLLQVLQQSLKLVVIVFINLLAQVQSLFKG